MKLKEKVREGGKVRRVYEEPRTPYQRLLELGKLKPREGRALEARYQALDPVKLRRRIEQLRTELFETLEREKDLVIPKTRRHGPSIQVGMEKESRSEMKKNPTRKAGQERPGRLRVLLPKASAPKLHQRNGDERFGICQRKEALRPE